MPKLYIFVGPPGSGKTTVANIICETGAVHIWADRERQAMFGNPTHDVSESMQLYNYLNTKTTELLESGKDVVFDTNFNFRKDRDHLRSIAKQTGAQLVIIHMTTDVELARSRALKGDHAERNGMSMAMSPETFEGIVNNLQPLGDDEPTVEFNGEHLEKQPVLRALNLL